MKNHYFLFGEGSQINQLICAVLINLPVVAYGASIGWMSPMTLLLQSENSPRDRPLSDTELSWMASVAYLTCVPAGSLMAFMGDNIGRKTTLMFISAMSLACWITKLSSMETWAFVLARALVGINMAGCYVICPLYTKEISDDRIRGLLGSLMILFQTSGNLFLYVIGDVLSYHTILWICVAMPTFHLIFFLVMPESPSYLVKNGKMEKAASVIAWLRCRRVDDDEVIKELDVIQKELDKDAESNKFALKAILTDKILLKAFLIAVIITVAREVCGAIPVLNFAGDIFSMASSGTSLVLSPNQQAMMLGAVQVAGSMLASSVVEKAGRKPLLIITSLVSGLSMCVLASWFMARDNAILAPAWLPITTLCLCIFCDASGLQPVSVVITGEIFSYKYRGTVMAVTLSTSAFASFFQLLFFKPLANSVGIHISFFFFGIVCLATAVYVILVVPETKQRSLSEIYEDMKPKNDRKKENDNKIVEERYKSILPL